MTVQQTEPSHKKTLLWWKILSAIAVFNICLWVTANYYLHSQVGELSQYTSWHLSLSGVYVAACAFRSFWPRIDLERYVIVDHWISSVVLGRSAATLAEISFAIQMKLFIDELYTHTPGGFLQGYTWIIVFTLSLAQLFCWLGVISLNHLGHFIEESLWGLTFTLIMIALATAIPSLDGTWLTISWLGMIACFIYVLYMFCVDVPMYYQRMKKGKQGPESTSLSEQFSDAWSRRVLTRSWSIWKPEAVWLTGYFAAAVWLSLSLAFLPR